MRAYTFAFSIAAHLTVLLWIVISPLIATDVLPEPRRAVAFVEVIARPAPLPPSAPLRGRSARSAGNADAAPLQAPPTLARETGFELTHGADTTDAGIPDGVPYGQADGLLIGEPAPPPPPARPAAPIHVGSAIKPPQKIRDVLPAYPAIAQSARVQGGVILQAVISEDGRVRTLKVLRSIPLLDQAAVDAVRQWQFTPTLLNGEPVAVVMTVTVVFTLKS